MTVPNVPCGVERSTFRITISLSISFLMYRVELKALKPSKPTPNHSLVPNVPCGVERPKVWNEDEIALYRFLMYRVELKALLSSKYLLTKSSS